jgi:hypothetical protein
MKIINRTNVEENENKLNSKIQIFNLLLIISANLFSLLMILASFV